MAGVTLTVNAADHAAIQHQLERVEQFLGSPRPLLKTWGLRTIKWIEETFDQEGRPKWAPLAQSTLRARKKEGKEGKALQDSGRLRRSFKIVEEDDQHVTVATDQPTAVWAQFGTPAHVIEAKNALALAIPGLEGKYSRKGFAGAKPTGRGSYLFSGPLRRGRTFKAGAIHIGAGKQAKRAAGAFSRVTFNVKVPYTQVAFFAKVKHPGTPPRPILPTDEQIIPVLEKTGEEVLRRIAEGT